MALAGLRVGELCALRWRDVDLAGGKLRVADAKTEAGERTVDLTPMLLDELKLHRARTRFADQTDYVFATSRGTARQRSNITRQVLAPAILKANADSQRGGHPPIIGVTNHSLRRTYCSMLFEAGARPPTRRQQMGHTDPSLALVDLHPGDGAGSRHG